MIAKIALAAVALILCYAAFVVVINRLAKPGERDLPVVRDSPLPAASNTLSLVTWNLGYAGLGEESDFISDGGKSLRPPNAATVQKNLRGIVETLTTLAPDVFLLQEVAEPSFVNFGTDLRGAVMRTLTGRASSFRTDTVTKAVPRPLRVALGTMIVSGREITSATLHPLPLEDSYGFGFLRKLYGLHAARIPTGDGNKAWVVINIHLAAFDDNAEVRYAQLERTIAVARREYEAGNYVVLGGDWNLVLAKTAFHHNTDEKFLFWIYDFPRQLLPDGWTIAADPAIPSVRTNHQPYMAGDNFTTIIDGYLLSPNIAVESVRTLDLGFKYSDHQPVQLTARAK
ncbi:MAG: hypothetical protein HQ495_08275 [Alphaproteobacteria bacterium]|nr:hypothetical protein [Alphaproteobacteria bacterium]